MAKYKGTSANDRLVGGNDADTVDGRAGNDVLIGNLGNDALTGGEGRDLLIGDVESDWSSIGNDTLSGGDGNDLLSGGNGDDILRGGAGDDLLFGGTVANARLEATGFVTQLYTNKSGNDTIDGGAGNDLAYLAFDDTAGVKVDVSNAAAVAQITSGTAMVGSITGVEAVVLYGGTGRDDVVGGVGDDILFGNAGGDRLHGGLGNDWLEGGLGDDLLDGGEGIDRIQTSYSGAALDISYDLSLKRAQQTGFGRDTLISIENVSVSNMSGGVTLKGNASDNAFTVLATGTIRVSGGDGSDVVYAQVYNGAIARAVLAGGDGDDSLTVGGTLNSRADVEVAGGAGDDFVSVLGASGDAVVSAGDGNDRVEIDPSRGASRIALGNGADTLALTYEYGSGRQVMVVDGFTAGQGGDVLSIVNWVGSALTNFSPSQANPFLDGHLRFVGSGKDTLLQIDRDGGGDGWIDLIRFTGISPAALVPANVSGYALVEGLVRSGGSGDDHFDGNAGDDLLSGGAGNDALTGGVGGDILYGDDEEDAGSGGNDVLDGGSENDILVGGTGDDVLTGGDGNDLLVGGAGYGAMRNSPSSASVGVITTTDEGTDMIDGGAGQDRAYLSYARDTGIRLDVSDPAAVATVRSGGKVIGSITGVESLTIYTLAGTGDDRIVTGAGGDAVYTGDGDDFVSAGAGNDTINGGAGNDKLDGGAGSDTVRYVALPGALHVDLSVNGKPQDTGGGGVDALTSIENLYVRAVGTDTSVTGSSQDNLLIVDREVDAGAIGGVVASGGDGSDTIAIYSDGIVTDGSASVIVDGGAGDDDLDIQYSGPRSSAHDTLKIVGGAGADTISLTGQGSATIDAGSGADQIRIDLPVRATAITLGSDADRVTITANASGTIARDALHFTDFEVGTGKDVLVLNEWLGSGVLSGFQPGQDPFGDGYLGLRQSGANTQLLVDQDGGGDSFKVLATFENVSSSAFVDANFDGFSPTFEASVRQPVAPGLHALVQPTAPDIAALA